MRNILLVEPDYQNKYPPLGLMKISAYHKNLGDRVVFVKGKSADLQNFIWDKIYITTLFTFHWKKTIETIKFYKRSVSHTDNFHIGGIMASLLQKEIYNEIDIKPHFGLLTSAKCIGENSSKNIDLLTPDYDILDEINYKYPANNAYITNTTKGCTRHCEFCAVHRIEPEFIGRIKIKNQIETIDRKYGQRRNLLLLDNNVLASDKFDEIIDEIKDLGFQADAMFVDPILFKIYINRLRNEKNVYEERKLKDKIIKEIFNLEKRIKARELLKQYVEIIKGFEFSDNSVKTELFDIAKRLMPLFEKYHNKAPKERHVDYNQGVDLRHLTEEKMKKFSEIAIKPLRIAFDHLSLKEQYVHVCKLADKYKIKELSNYLLYNYKDSPNDLYERLRINIELNENLNNSTIYSFPMKYIPVDETDRKKFIGKKWSLKSIRTIQAISNVTKGVIGAGSSFFRKAFGNDVNEFQKLIIMPEDYIIYRKESEKNGNTDKWWKQYSSLTERQKEETNDIIHKNDFQNIEKLTEDKAILEVLKHYKRDSKPDK